MSEHAAAVAALEERFNDFVVERAGVAERWEVMDRRPLEPFDFVMFSREEDGRADDTAEHFPPFFYNTMEIYMKRTEAERKEHGLAIPSVLVEQQATGIQILDPYVKLYDIVPDYRPQEKYYPWTLAHLLDRMERLEARDMFMAAGQRTFPDTTGFGVY